MDKLPIAIRPVVVTFSDIDRSAVLQIYFVMFGQRNTTGTGLCLDVGLRKRLSNLGRALEKIGAAIRAYIERGLTRPVVPSPASLPADAADYEGWYEPVSPRNEFMHYSERLVGLHRMWFEHGNMVFSNLIGTAKEAFVPVSGEHFRYLPQEGPPEPMFLSPLKTALQHQQIVLEA